MIHIFNVMCLASLIPSAIVRSPSLANWNKVDIFLYIKIDCHPLPGKKLI